MTRFTFEDYSTTRTVARGEGSRNEGTLRCRLVGVVGTGGTVFIVVSMQDGNIFSSGSIGSG